MNKGEDKDEQMDEQDLMFQKFMQEQKQQEEEKIKKLEQERAAVK